MSKSIYIPHGGQFVQHNDAKGAITVDMLSEAIALRVFEYSRIISTSFYTSMAINTARHWFRHTLASLLSMYYANQHNDNTPKEWTSTIPIALGLRIHLSVKISDNIITGSMTMEGKDDKQQDWQKIWSATADTTLHTTAVSDTTMLSLLADSYANSLMLNLVTDVISQSHTQ